VVWYNIALNTFLHFFVIPFSEGTFFKASLYFYGFALSFSAKMSGIFIALCVNYLLGFLFAFVSQRKGKVLRIHSSFKIYFLCLLTFIPVISGVVALFLGMAKKNFFLFIAFSMTINFICGILSQIL
jgi:hypothetical protein